MKRLIQFLSESGIYRIFVCAGWIYFFIAVFCIAFYDIEVKSRFASFNEVFWAGEPRILSQEQLDRNKRIREEANAKEQEKEEWSKAKKAISSINIALYEGKREFTHEDKLTDECRLFVEGVARDGGWRIQWNENNFHQIFPLK